MHKEIIGSTYIYSACFINPNKSNALKVPKNDKDTFNNDSINESCLPSSYVLFGGSNNNICSLFEYRVSENLINTEVTNESIIATNKSKEMSITSTNISVSVNDEDYMNTNQSSCQTIFKTNYLDSACLDVDFNPELNIISTAWGDGNIRSLLIQ